MNVVIGTETPIFLFWEYLFRNFGILTLQCSSFRSVFINYCNLIVGKSHIGCQFFYIMLFIHSIPAGFVCPPLAFPVIKMAIMTASPPKILLICFFLFSCKGQIFFRQCFPFLLLCYSLLGLF